MAANPWIVNPWLGGDALIQCTQHLVDAGGDPVLTVERAGSEWGDVVVHKSAEELELMMQDDGTLGGMARLALEIVRLRG